MATVSDSDSISIVMLQVLRMISGMGFGWHTQWHVGQVCEASAQLELRRET